MAANILDIDTGGVVALTAATARTVLGVKAATNIALRVKELQITTDGATSTNVPVVVELTRITFATNSPGTNSTTVTPNKREPARAETPQLTAAKAWTAGNEPTVVTAVRTFHVPQYQGGYIYPIDDDDPFFVAGGQGVGVRANSPNNVNVAATLVVEE